MPQVSRIPLKPHIRDEILSSLWWILAEFKTEKEIKFFLGELLTKTEKTMLGKRLTIALLLIKGYTYVDIKRILKVSTSTIVKIRLWLDEGDGGYKLAVNRLLQRSEINTFLKQVAKTVARYVARNIRFS